ncbi:MAG: HEPN domain-containing protein, partial [Candidatus Zixiibacteriota bacterium]
SNLKDNYLKKYGDRYNKRFINKTETAEKRILKAGGKSILSSYGNIIEWRNQFAHKGEMPNTATFEEVTSSYEAGKEIIHCLAQTMKY